MVDDAAAARKLFFLVLVVYSQARTATSQHFETMASKKVKDEFIYSKVENVSLIQCTALGASNDDFKSASYNSNEGSCHMTSYTVNGSSDQEGLVDDLSWRTISKLPSSALSCEDGWLKAGERCYYFNMDYETYIQAAIICKQKGGKLAEPQTSQDFELLLKMLHAYCTDPGDTECYISLGKIDYWFGLQDLNGNFSYVWRSNGAVPRYTVWSNRPRIDYCVYMDSNNEFKWTTLNCIYVKRSICEI